MQDFRILVLDDDIKVIQRLRDRISPQHIILGTTWNIQLSSIHITVSLKDDEVHFSDDTLEQVVRACSQPPHLILADFGYASPQQSQQLRDGLLSPQQFIDTILTTPDLLPEVERFLEANHSFDKHLVKMVQASLKNNPCRMFLYTYTPLEFKHALPSVEARKKRTQTAFRQSIVFAIDTLEDFYDNEKYVSKHDKDFYAYLVTGLLEHLIREELLLFVLKRETERLKYIRYYRSGVGVLVIVLLGGAIGAVAEWLGARIMGLILSGLWMPAVLIIVLAAIMFFILGLFVPIIFERFMSNLLRKFRSEESGPDA